MKRSPGESHYKTEPMESADHSQFKFAAERYILGELPEEEKLAFEEHYFSCGACAQDVEDLTTLRLAAPAVLPRFDQGIPKSEKLGWFAAPWLAARWVPQFALGALALLVLVTGYQNAVEIPRLKAASDDSLQVMAAPRPLIAQRGAAALTIAGLPKTAPVLITNEWPAEYPLYEVRVTRRGASETVLHAEAEIGRGALLITIPAKKLGAGKFDLTVSGRKSDGAPKDVARYPFTIQGE